MEEETSMLEDILKEEYEANDKRDPVYGSVRKDFDNLDNGATNNLFVVPREETQATAEAPLSTIPQPTPSQATQQQEEHFLSTTIPSPQTRQRSRYFIIKSYSAENVTTSLRRGVWATQKSNEQTFNDAFLGTPRVIMIFSINGSRHFQGYARMTSLIQPRVIDRNSDFGDAKWGNSFALNWERVGSVSFRESDHLKNPLAEDLPITRSRDGQEVPEKVGEELCRLIDRASVPITANLEFPITEEERECLANDPRRQQQQQQKGFRSGMQDRRQDRFQPYPSERPGQKTSGGGDRGGGGFSSVGNVGAVTLPSSIPDLTQMTYEDYLYYRQQTLAAAIQTPVASRAPAFLPTTPSPGMLVPGLGYVPTTGATPASLGLLQQQPVAVAAPASTVENETYVQYSGVQ